MSCFGFGPLGTRMTLATILLFSITAPQRFLRWPRKPPGRSQRRLTSRRRRPRQILRLKQSHRRHLLPRRLRKRIIRLLQTSPAKRRWFQPTVLQRLVRMRAQPSQILLLRAVRKRREQAPPAALPRPVLRRRSLSAREEPQSRAFDSREARSALRPPSNGTPPIRCWERPSKT